MLLLSCKSNSIFLYTYQQGFDEIIQDDGSKQKINISLQ